MTHDSQALVGGDNQARFSEIVFAVVTVDGQAHGFPIAVRGCERQDAE